MAPLQIIIGILFFIGSLYLSVTGYHLVNGYGIPLLAIICGLTFTIGGIITEIKNY
tara:strand:+ start:105 stop:272 length:168 start_codon:yes stop_codon:yes gene_type:complete